MIPVATPVLASNGALPTISVTGNNPALGGTAGQTFTVKVSNPASNQFTITAVSIAMPSGWTAMAAGCTAGGYLTVCNVGAGGAGVTWTVSTFIVGTGAGIPPGTFDNLAFVATAASGTYPFTSTFTSKIQDASSVSYYTGPSFSVLVIDPATLVTAVSPAASANYVAGSAALTETASITPAQAGVPIVFSAPGYGANVVYSFSPSTALTNAAGTATTTFQPSNHAGDATTVEATIGTSTVAPQCSGAAGCPGAIAITTVNGPPTEITWTLASSALSGNHYITTEGKTTNTNTGGSTFTGATMAAAGASFSLTDKFANPVSLASVTAYTFTLTALSGGGLFDAPHLPSVMTCSNGADWMSGATDLGVLCPAGAGPFNLPFNYYQASPYNSIGELSEAVTGTYNAAAFAGTGQTTQLITSTFATAVNAPVPVVIAPTGVTLPNVPAGDKVNVTATPTPPATCGGACPPQAGVPIQLYLDQANSFESVAAAMDYGAHSMLAVGFSNGALSTSENTNANGQASDLFTLDTCANGPNCPTGAHALFQANVTRITDTSPPNSLGISGDSAGVVTIANVPFTFTVLAYYATGPACPAPHTLCTPATHAATAGPLYLDAIISDKYGNLAVNTAITQIQVTLAASCGSGCPLSATTVYIPSGASDTYSTFGAITWTMPSMVGTVTLTASGVLSGVQKTSAPLSIGVVSPLPTLAVTSPVPQNGVIFSSTPSVIFNGQANTSIGYAATGPEAQHIVSVTYKVDSGAVQTAPISAAYDVNFAVAASFTAGLHHITFNATDSLGNSVTGQTYSVLVDTAAPTVGFTTKTGASVGAGQAVNATITVAEGDLNATSVVATLNGTAIASSSVVVTGANTLGSSVTYTVKITGLTAGHDVLGLSASSLAGLTGTATAITVTVTVPFSQSVVISSATYGTLGSFTGISVSATNVWSSSQSLVVFAVWKNSAGQTVAVTTGGLTLAAGASGTTFAPLASALPSGSYSVSVFVITTANLPVSSPTSITASV